MTIWVVEGESLDWMAGWFYGENNARRHALRSHANYHSVQLPYPEWPKQPAKTVTAYLKKHPEISMDEDAMNRDLV